MTARERRLNLVYYRQHQRRLARIEQSLAALWMASYEQFKRELAA